MSRAFLTFNESQFLLFAVMVLAECFSVGIAGTTTEFNFHFPELGSGLRSLQEEWLATRCVSNISSVDGNKSLKPILSDQIFNSKWLNDDKSGAQHAPVGYRVEYSLHQIHDSDDLYSSLGLSIGARLKAEGLVGAVAPGHGESKVDFAANRTFKKNQTYLLVKVKVRGPTIALSNEQDIRFTQEYSQKKTETIKDYVSRILIDCGDMYLHSYVLGGELYGLIETSNTTSESEQKTDQGFKFKLDFTGRAESDISQKVYKSLIENLAGEVKQIWMIQSGGQGVDTTPINNIEELSTRAGKFPLIVGSAPVPMEAHYQDYTELLRTGLKNPFLPEANEMIFKFGYNQKMFGYLSRVLASLSQFRSDLDRSLEDSSELSSADFHNIKEGYKYYETSERKIRKFIKECYLDYINCNVAAFIHESQDSMVGAASKFHKPKVMKNDIAVLHPEDQSFCMVPLNLQDVLENRDQVQEKVKKRGFWGFGRQCLVLKKKPSSPRDLQIQTQIDEALSGTSAFCNAALGSTVVQWRRNNFSVKCEKFPRGCQIACWL